MTKPFGIRAFRVLLLLVCAILMAGAACEKPVVGTMGEPVVAGGMQFSVTGYELRYLEFSEGEKTVSYTEPVLAISVQITNESDKPLSYTPSHRSQQMTEAGTPLLYRDPGAEAALPPQAKDIIGGVYLERGELAGQVVALQNLQPGQSLKDIFLFEVPPEKSGSLILSVPPSMHHGSMPVLIRIPYQYKEPKGHTVYAAGDPIARGAASFLVKSAEDAYIETTHTIEGKGYSSEPMLKISYTISNPGDQPLRYSPEHYVEGARGAAAYAGSTTLKRVKLPPNTRVVGQVQSATTIEPGKSVNDFVLFERPDESQDTLTFEFPASTFGDAGLIRVSVPYQHTEPELPKEMQKKSTN